MKKNNDFDFIQSLKNFFNIAPYMPIMEWIDENVNLIDDVSSEHNKPDFSQYPYQVEILKQWEKIDSRKVVTVVAAEQMGKSTMWIYGLLYRMVYDPCQSLIVYPSDGKAQETNDTKLKPLMRHIPALAEELKAKRSVRADRYKFSNLVSYFQGSGAKIVSKSCKIVIGDEIDQWNIEHPQNVRDLLKRTRSYSSSFAFLVCSPTVNSGHIWTNFLKGSQGYYTLRCKGCGKLTMRACDIHNLQFESVYNEELRSYRVKAGSERLVCPTCGYEHIEADKAEIIRNGEFVHKIPELIETLPSYQIGTLASQLPSLSWTEIANAALEAGKTADVSILQNFDNSWRGLPYKPRKVTKDELEKLRENHAWRQLPSLEEIEMIFVTSDTMDSFNTYAVWAWTTSDHLFLLDIGDVPYLFLDDERRSQINELLKHENKPPVKTLEDVINGTYLGDETTGIEPTFCVIDVGGHRSNDVKFFAQQNKKVIMQKGTSLSSCNWKMSENQQKLIISNEKYFKSQAIYFLYAQKNRNENYLYFSPDIDEEWLKQLRSMRPDNTKKWGDDYSEWSSQGEDDHAFDVLKYAYLGREFALATFMRKRYRFGQSALIKRRWEKNERKHQENQQKNIEKRSWFT